MLHTNGGMLELKKCFWIFISWKWIKGVAKMKTSDEITKELKIRQTEDNTVVTIPKKMQVMLRGYYAAMWRQMAIGHVSLESGKPKQQCLL